MTDAALGSCVRRNTQGRETENGFTLVEMLVALAIFALIASAGVGLLAFSVRAQAAARDRQAELSGIRRLTMVMTADLAQAAPREARGIDGERHVAFLGGTGAPGSLALAFVRRGWSNEAGDPRASLQKIEYRRVGDRIERRAFPMIDGATGGAPSVIARGVADFRLRYRVEGEWRDRWDLTRPGALPKAVEAVADVKGLGPVRQVFLVGTGY